MLPFSLRRFLLPRLSKRYLLRLVLVAAACYLLFGFLLIPLQIRGKSMEPTYHDGGFAFCWRLQYLFSPPKRFDVVAVRFAGRRVMLLKRIVALEGESVAFRQGILYVNEKPVDEPYVVQRSNWDLPPRTVEPGHVYVVGDNRGVAMNVHRFGQVLQTRIVGGVIP